MTLFNFLLSIAVPGFLGGIVSALRETIQEESNEPGENPNVRDACKKCGGFHYLGSRGLIGVAGAFGVVLLSHMVGQIKPENTPLNVVFIISLSLIGGTISFKVLSAIGNKIADQLLERKVDETGKQAHAALSEAKAAASEAKFAADEAKNAVAYSSAIAHADTALTRREYNDMPQAIERLESIRDKFPQDRTLFIYLGRLYRAVGKLDRAITVLRDFVTNLRGDFGGITRAPSRTEVDSSDAHYNIACYHILKASELKAKSDPELKHEIERITEEAYRDLEISFQIWKRNAQYAKKDPDFDPIRGEARFLELIAQHAPIEA